MDFTPAVQELVEQTGRVAVNWRRGGKLEVLLIGDVDHDGQLDSLPVADPNGEILDLVNDIVAGDPNITRVHLTLTLPGNVDGSAHRSSSAKPQVVMR